MLLVSDHWWIIVVSLAIDALVGDPPALWRRVPHPVVAMGKLIGGLDAALNRESWPAAWRRLAGVCAISLCIIVAIGVGAAVEQVAARTWGGDIVVAVIAAVLLAQRSLVMHVARVEDAFASAGVEAARGAVAMIVGRDPVSLDEPGICRAAIESCAENFSDGVVAPTLWLALFGLPGIMAYKIINTADSMIGHRNARYEAFGWAAARLDDIANLPAARLAGLLIAASAPAAGGSMRTAFVTMLRDARLHRSPNAGWPECAMAGALGLALGGPRVYPGHKVDELFLNAGGGRDAAPGDIGRAIRVVIAACALHGLIFLVLGLAL